MRSPKDFFRPLAVGAPDPVREIPVRPSRMIHFFPPRTREDGGQGARHRARRSTCCSATSRTASPPTDKEAARAGLVEGRPRTIDLGDTQLWTRVNSLDSPWALDDLTTARHRDRRQARRDHDPEGRGPRGHPLRRPPPRPARGQGRADRAAARPRHPRDGPRRGQRRGDLRRQPPHAGPVARPGRPRRQPPHEDHPGRRRPPRLPRAPGPRPATTSRPTAPTYQQDLWHYTIARMVDACAANGILPFYGPFGDIKDTVACEDQFRNAFLLGCVGAWSLHPVQIDIAKKVFSPDPADVGPRPAGHRGHGRRHRRGDARREDGGRRLGQAVPGDRRPGPRAGRPRPRAGRRAYGFDRERRPDDEPTT